MTTTGATTVDRDGALAATYPQEQVSWDARDVILYNLGVGAGTPADDEHELRYVYEEDLTVLPSFAVIPCMPPMEQVVNLTGLPIALDKLLHGEHEVVLHDVIPTAADATRTMRIAEVYDKGKAALGILETTLTGADGRPLATNRASMFVRGAGGFGGPPAPAPTAAAPDRAPDREFTVATDARQALIYRLCGDLNPLHVDPGLAGRAGFDRPILHGLSVYGAVCKGVVEHLFGGDPSRIGRYATRFAGVTYPGETLVVSAWQVGNEWRLAARTVERGELVLTHAIAEPRSR